MSLLRRVCSSIGGFLLMLFLVLLPERENNWLPASEGEDRSYGLEDDPRDYH